MLQANENASVAELAQASGVDWTLSPDDVQIADVDKVEVTTSPRGVAVVKALTTNHNEVLI